MKIACFTVAAMDYFSQQDEYYAGGNSLNQAIRFRKLGHETKTKIQLSVSKERLSKSLSY